MSQYNGIYEHETYVITYVSDVDGTPYHRTFETYKEMVDEYVILVNYVKKHPIYKEIKTFKNTFYAREIEVGK